VENPIEERYLWNVGLLRLRFGTGVLAKGRDATQAGTPTRYQIDKHSGAQKPNAATNHVH